MILSLLTFSSNLYAACSLELSSGDLLKFNKRTLTIDSTGSKFTIYFKHEGEMAVKTFGHNVVIVETKNFEKVKSKGFFNQNDIKPIFPENPPPKLDPKTGMHPQYGKKAGRYKKLDPISANSMPTTGDPEIDTVVNKQKTINKIKKMARNK